MMRPARFAFIATLVAGVAFGCSSAEKPKPGDSVGSVGLAISLSEKVEVDVVRYSITGAGSKPLEGNIPVKARGATISALIELAAGVGYTLELAAVSTDQSTVCLGEALFDVVAGQTTKLSLVLACHVEKGAGAVEVNASLNSCPQLSSVAVAPLAIAVGGSIEVSAAASDLDVADMLTFSWTASGGGTFAAPSQASTTFTCSTAGTYTLKAAVSDGKCGDTRPVTVTCTP